MAKRTWNSLGDTDMGDGNNYTGDGPLLETDELAFDETSSVDAVMSGSLSVKSITVDNAYAGTLRVAPAGNVTVGDMVDLRPGCVGAKCA